MMCAPLYRGPAAERAAAAENHLQSLVSSWLRFQQSQETLAAQKLARERLDKVLETYTDVTRFPRCALLFFIFYTNQGFRVNPMQSKLKP
jgi:hypothetical protein